MPDRPNVLMLIVDDLRPQLGCYGQTQMLTPNIDRLASQSRQFNRHYCQQAICGPSRNHIMTGCRPDTIGIYGLRTRLHEARPDLITLPGHFQGQGYTTYQCGKVYHSKADDPEGWTVNIEAKKADQVGRGYLTVDSIMQMEDNMAALHARGIDKQGLGPAYERGPDDTPYQDQLNTDAVIEQIQSGPTDPFFLAAGFAKPHLPFCAPAAYWDLYDRATIEVPDESAPSHVTPYSLTQWGELRHYAGMPDEGPMPEELGRTLIHGYYACVSYLDAQVGRILDALDQQGLRENTHVIFCVDHAMKLGEHGSWSKHTVFEADTRVPLLISPASEQSTNAAMNPDSATAHHRAPGQTDALSQNIDLFPSLCDLCGLDTPAQVEGTSLRPWLDDPAHPSQPAAYSQYPRPEVMAYAARTDRFRYVEWRAYETGQVRARELYDHQTDPGEQANVIDDPAYAEHLPPLAKLLEQGT